MMLYICTSTVIELMLFISVTDRSSSQISRAYKHTLVPRPHPCVLAPWARVSLFLFVLAQRLIGNIKRNFLIGPS